MAARAQLARFLAAVVFFHGSEYLLAVAFHGRRNVTANSLLISKQYVLAMACALLENMIELTFFPELKNNLWVSNIGLAMVLIGEIIRKCGILTAGRAFTHTIRIYHEQQHELITHGIYSLMRHPGYSGFFIWATGTQVMLCNPVCIVAFALVIWRFFSRRIPYPFWQTQCNLLASPCSVFAAFTFSPGLIFLQVSRYKDLFLFLLELGPLNHLILISWYQAGFQKIVILKQKQIRRVFLKTVLWNTICRIFPSSSIWSSFYKMTVIENCSGLLLNGQLFNFLHNRGRFTGF